MEKQKLNIKVRDLEPLKDVTGGRHRAHRHARAFAQGVNNVGEYGGGLGPFGLNRIP
jgi:hypothetical protein